MRDEVAGAAGTVVDKKELGERERDAQYWAPGCWAQRPGRVRGGEREASRPRAAGLRERWGAGREDISFCRGALGLARPIQSGRCIPALSRPPFLSPTP